jgi:carboxypeptidase family protein
VTTRAKEAAYDDRMTARNALLQTTALILLAGIACSAESAASATRSGIRGVVQAGPTCPVETPESPCPDRPVPGASVTAEGGPDGRVHRTSTDDQGAFRLRLRPGSYDLTATSDTVFGCDSQRVRVTRNRYRDVTITCDTGIR